MLRWAHRHQLRQAGQSPSHSTALQSTSPLHIPTPTCSRSIPPSPLLSQHIKDGKGKEVKADAITAALETQADAAAALLQLLPLLVVRAMLGGADSDPIRFRLDGGATTADGEVAVALVSREAHAAPALPPASFVEAHMPDRLAIGAALWQVEEAIAPMLPCQCPLRKLDPSGVRKASGECGGGDTAGGGGRGRKGKGSSSGDDEGGGKAKAEEADSVPPVHWVRERAQVMLLQLQLAMYKALSQGRGSAHDDADEDDATLLRALRRLQAVLRECVAPPCAAHATAHASSTDLAAALDTEIAWSPLEPTAAEWLPSWLSGAGATHGAVAGTGGADPAACGAGGEGGAARGWLADGFDAPRTVPVEDVRSAALRMRGALELVSLELRALSAEGLARLSRHHRLLEGTLATLADGGHAKPTPTPPPRTGGLAAGGLERAPAHDDAPDLLPIADAALDGLGDVRRWVYALGEDADPILSGPCFSLFSSLLILSPPLFFSGGSSRTPGRARRPKRRACCRRRPPTPSSAPAAACSQQAPSTPPRSPPRSRTQRPSGPMPPTPRPLRHSRRSSCVTRRLRSSASSSRSNLGASSCCAPSGSAAPPSRQTR